MQQFRVFVNLLLGDFIIFDNSDTRPFKIQDEDITIYDNRKLI